MFKRSLRFVLFLSVHLVCIAANAQTPIALTQDEPSKNITFFIQSGTSPHQVHDPRLVEFKDVQESELKLSYSDQDLWIRFRLKNNSELPLQKVLLLDSPLSGKLTLIKESSVRPPERSGPGYPLSERAYQSRLGAFSITLEPQEDALFYLKRSSHHALNAHVMIVNPTVLEDMEGMSKGIFFFYLGGILSLVIYNFMLGLFTTQKDHLIYSLFAASFGTTAMVLHGVFDTYLWPQKNFVFSNYLMLFSSLSLFSASLFVCRFLNIKKDFALGYWGLRVFCGLALVTMVVSFFAPQFPDLYIFGYWIDISIASGILFFVFCGIYVLIRQNYALAYYFLLSWFVVLIGTLIWLASLHGLIRSSSFTQYSLLFANLGEMLVLSLGLAYKIKILDEEKRRAILAAEDKERYHRLVRVLSHDVANTVSGLMYHTEMLEELCQDDVLRNHVHRITKSTGQLDQILRTVRQEEVFHSFKSHHDLQLVEVGAACREAASHYTWELEEKNISVTIEVPPGKFIRADRSALINQVLSNLLSNSIKFTESGCNIWMTYFEQKNEVGIAVKDEGLGIPPNEVDLIFKGKKLFSNKGTQNEKGTGLGTSLVREYMKLFGGRIEVQSIHRSQNALSGTTVRLIFPRP